MILYVNHLLRMMEIIKPTLVVPAVPPSDNRRTNRKVLAVREEIRVFKGHVEATLLSENLTLPPPPVVVLYQIHFPTKHYREPKNCSKALIDALYPQRRGGDDDVGSWDYPFRLIDRVNPRTEIWIVGIETDSPSYGVVLRTR